MDPLIVAVTTWTGALLITALGWAHELIAGPGRDRRKAEKWARIASGRSRSAYAQAPSAPRVAAG